MITAYTFYPSLLVSSSLISGLFLVLLIKYRARLFAQSLMGLALITLGINLSLLFAMYSPNQEVAIFWHGNLRIIFNVFLGPAGFFFAYSFLGGKNKTLLWVILSLPILTIFVSLTNNTHHWLFSAYVMRFSQYYIRTSWQPGWWFNLVSSCSYLISLGVFYLLLFQIGKTRYLTKIRRLIVLGVITTVVASLTLDTFGLFAAPGILNTPVGLGIMNLALVVSIWYFDLFDILPVARETLTRYMSDGVFVVDNDNKILDANPAAMRLVNLPAPEVIGKDVLGFIVPKERVEVAHQILENEFHGIVPLTIQAEERFFDILVTNIIIEQTVMAAKLIVLRDITELRQLQEQDRQRTALEERQRLARDLHDAVSQTLFSARLTSEMMLRQKKTITPEKLWENIAHFSNLAKSALGEMRILLLELRPESLTNAELSSLLTHLADAANSRIDAQIHLEIQAQTEQLPVEVKIAFYRIAQEALNNIIKHARSRSVNIQYVRETDWAKLVIVDDGVGISIGEGKGAHMGMVIMRERAREIDAELDITSQPNKGTQVTCLWKQTGSAR